MRGNEKRGAEKKKFTINLIYIKKKNRFTKLRI